MKTLKILGSALALIFCLELQAYEASVFLKRQWSEGINRMCQYQDGTVLNMKSRSCPSQKPTSGGNAQSDYLMKEQLRLGQQSTQMMTNGMSQMTGGKGLIPLMLEQLQGKTSDVSAREILVPDHVRELEHQATLRELDNFKEKEKGQSLKTKNGGAMSRKFIDSVLKKESQPGWIGIDASIISPQLAQEFNLSSDVGLYIFKVHKGSPAYAANVSKGDIILKIHGESFSNERTVASLIAKRSPDPLVNLEILRGKEILSTVAHVISRPKLKKNSFSKKQERYYLKWKEY